MNPVIVYVAVEIIFAIILMWEATISMVEKKNIWKFSPFFVKSIARLYDAAFVLNLVYMQFAWLFVEILSVLSIALVLKILMEEK